MQASNQIMGWDLFKKDTVTQREFELDQFLED
jgi:hypothetical protein